jgi:hypothetical protein
MKGYLLPNQVSTSIKEVTDEYKGVTGTDYLGHEAVAES